MSDPGDMPQRKVMRPRHRLRRTARVHAWLLRTAARLRYGWPRIYEVKDSGRGPNPWIVVRWTDPLDHDPRP